MDIPLLAPERRWSCPNCDLEDVTHEATPHSRMHTCPGARGMTVPMVPAGIRCKVELQPREDYVNGDVVQLDEDGRPWMSALVTRDTGTDVAVYAPCATANLRES
jgi:hypothetical protein